MTRVADQLATAIDAVATVDLDDLTDDELDAQLVALIRLRHRLDATIARRAGRWVERWRSDG